VVLPKLGAVVIVLVLWQAVVLSGWRPDYLLPGPLAVFRTLGDELRTREFWAAVGITMTRAATGYALAIVIGTAVGVAVAGSAWVRSAVGSLITGLQTIPSIVWFPFAILLFQIGESAILFVVVMGAAPSIANGIITGIDLVPRQLLSAGRILGAGGGYLYRRVILPASMPQVLAGLKQGWAFAWRSLMAGELLTNGKPALGVLMNNARDQVDASLILALLIVILVIGILVDAGFGRLDQRIRSRRGLLQPAS
jgi:NitT/TauT family transport system permease protein